ncbi:sarcosine oxidase subunit alpha family protein [Dongia deserti]|uniref:sarcosine oxidase subunit alpha family protein n=1 Tax=Dongia deserti TaxID=2268030 RepID=UPI000E65DF2B|nr:sarcosine oxidase subunit alpha family protein [Dongia deserti]
MTGFRLKSGGAIDRGKPLGFSFDGRTLHGFRGDTLASALLANGERLVARSFKYHRPRGIMSAGIEETSALVTIGSGARTIPNTLASTEELVEGLEAHSQHCWPNLRFDLGAINQLSARLFSAGFYYKTFMGPGNSPKSWLFYERFIRRAAGLGVASREPDPDHYESCEASCDLLVIGAGPAGIEAARVAAEAGLDVILVERDFALGGGLLQESEAIEGINARGWLLTRERSLRGASNVRVLSRTMAFGLYDHGVAGLVERLQPAAGVRERFWIVRAKRIVLAAGALERPLIFGNNDRPGVMLTSALRAYVNRWGVAAGTRIVIATNNDSAYAAASDIARAGIATMLLDAREDVSGPLPEMAKSAGVELRLGGVPVRAIGRQSVRALEVARIDGKAGETIDCDAMGMSGGWSPTQHLLSQRGVRPVWNETLAAFLPGEAREPVRCIGAATGIWRTDDCARSGRAAGAEAAHALGRSAPKEDFPAPGGWDYPIRPWIFGGIKGKAFVDIQNDVTFGDVRQACHEGYDAPELLKRYTTLGMATDQGRTSAVNALAVIAKLRGGPLDAIGTTTFRPPFAPVSIGALAGAERDQHLLPTRRSPMHDALVTQGARMLETGLWLRPWFYPQGTETVDEAYLREMRLVREAVGICDVSTLGKIAVQGPDAGELLDRVYVNAFKSLAIGKARYGVMLRDDGIVMDDGTSWRLGEHEYFMTTTTANAGKVMAWLEELLEMRWPDLRVAVTSVTDQWAGASVAGPLARDLLQALVADLDFSNDAFPFMGVREGSFNGVPCRIARISFSGELAYEIYVPADHGQELWRALLDGATARRGGAYGLEALGALRIEKGHVGGPELDGRATLDDLGLGRMASTKKAFIGGVLRTRPDLQRKDRPQLVGLVPVTKGEIFKGGSILCEGGNETGHGLGWVTSVTESPSLGHWVGIGLLKGGLSEWGGRTLLADDPIRGRRTLVKVVAPHFLDPEGKRLNG